MLPPPGSDCRVCPSALPENLPPAPAPAFTNPRRRTRTRRRPPWHWRHTREGRHGLEQKNRKSPPLPCSCRKHPPGLSRLPTSVPPGSTREAPAPGRGEQGTQGKVARGQPERFGGRRAGLEVCIAPDRRCSRLVPMAIYLLTPPHNQDGTCDSHSSDSPASLITLACMPPTFRLWQGVRGGVVSCARRCRTSCDSPSPDSCSWGPCIAYHPSCILPG